jgi:hypothetical protein
VTFIPEPWLRRARHLWPPVALVLCSGLVISLVALNAPAAIRAVPVLTYIGVVPGLACVRLIRLPDRLSEFLLGVGLSLALGAVVAMAMIYAHRWSPTLGIAALGSITSIAAVLELIRRRPDPPVNPSLDGQSS